MARTDTLTNYLTDVATAIKNKKGSQTPIQASAFDTEIANLPSGSGGPDWTQIGYTGTPQSVTEGFNYAKDIYDNWDTTITDYTSKYQNDKKLTYFPNVSGTGITTALNMFSNCSSLQEANFTITTDTDAVNNFSTSGMFSSCSSLKKVSLTINLNMSRITASSMFYGCVALETIDNFSTGGLRETNSMFSGCTNLKNIPVLNMVGARNTHQYMFSACPSLTDTSLDNILQMCINSSITGTKTLAYMGFTSSNYPASRIEALPHYQDFINDGWTIGY